MMNLLKVSGITNVQGRYFNSRPVVRELLEREALKTKKDDPKIEFNDELIYAGGFATRDRGEVLEELIDLGAMPSFVEESGIALPPEVILASMKSELMTRSPHVAYEEMAVKALKTSPLKELSQSQEELVLKKGDIGSFNLPEGSFISEGFVSCLIEPEDLRDKIFLHGCQGTKMGAAIDVVNNGLAEGEEVTVDVPYYVIGEQSRITANIATFKVIGGKEPGEIQEVEAVFAEQDKSPVIDIWTKGYQKIRRQIFRAMHTTFEHGLVPSGRFAVPRIYGDYMLESRDEGKAFAMHRVTPWNESSGEVWLGLDENTPLKVTVSRN